MGCYRYSGSGGYVDAVVIPVFGCSVVCLCVEVRRRLGASVCFWFWLVLRRLGASVCFFGLVCEIALLVPGIYFLSTNWY